MSIATLNKGIYETRFSQKNTWKKWGSASTNRWTGESLQRNHGLSGFMRPFGVSYWGHWSLSTDRWLDGGSSAGWSAGFAKLELGIDDKSGLEWSGHVFFVWADGSKQFVSIKDGFSFYDADIQMPPIWKETPIVIPSWCGAAQATAMDLLERRAGIASSRWDRWTRAARWRDSNGILEGASRFNERWGHRCVWGTTLTDVENYPFGTTWVEHSRCGTGSQ